MNKHLSTYTIVIIVLVSIAILLQAGGFLLKVGLIALSLSVGEPGMLQELASISGMVLPMLLIFALLGLGLFIVRIIYLIKLIKIKKDLILWTHIAFGYSVLLILAGFSFALFSPAALLGAFISTIFWLGVYVPVWVTYVVHLQKAKKEGLMDFS